MYKVIHKPWGKEEWLELNDRYCYKRIYINAGYKTSYQYHNFKRETNYLIAGTAEVWLEDDRGVVEKKIMHAGEFFNVTPPKKHRVIAITDIILQEVSTPEVDDVIRLEDDTNRKDGRIEGEHKTPAVLILSAGYGTRLDNLTTHVNKALLPINNKAIISHIVEKFPLNYEIVVAVGYKKNSLIEYCNLAHPDRTFHFVEIDNIDSNGSGPGYSALKCKQLLQRPFYITTADCIIDSTMPYLDGNWLGISPTSYPEKYSTINVDDHNNVLAIINKSNNGYDNAFIGLAGIWDYDIFWSELESNMVDGEVVAAFYNPSSYPSLKTKQPKWLDTGNVDDFSKAKDYFKDKPLSLHKLNGEIVYNVDRFLKFSVDQHVIENKSKRATTLKDLIPSNFSSSNNFISYDWETGKTLYEINDISVYEKFLTFFKTLVTNSDYFVKVANVDVINKFYGKKTIDRKEMFLNRFSRDYELTSYVINGKKYKPLNELLSLLNINSFVDNPMYKMFHGDLQFDNILYNSDTNKFTYIDWRDSFGGLTDYGDLYYDLAKLYGGCLIPYNLAKNDTYIHCAEGMTHIEYSYNTPQQLIAFKRIYEQWMVSSGYDLQKIKSLTALIFLNMSPLHSPNFAKMLWFKSIEMLSDDYK